MSSTPVRAALRHLRTLQVRDSSDQDLLERFAAGREEGAFAALVQRHGPMVLSVCRRVLGSLHDAEDAFQATFLVLARKAASIHKREALASWLHGVAFHLASKTRERKSRRHWHEGQAARERALQASPVTAWRELQEMLDGELQRLPAKYRLPLVMCALEGRTHEEAARQLGCPLGTVRSRVARARELLRVRLTRRGLTLSATAFGLALAANTANATLPPDLSSFAVSRALGLRAASTTAAALADEVLKGGIPKVKWVALMLIAGIVATCVGGWMYESVQEKTNADPPASVQPQAAEGPRTDRYGDPLPPDAIARLGTIRWRLDAHSAEELAVSPDGKSLVAVHPAKGITVVDTASGKAVRQIPEKLELREQWLTQDYWAVAAVSQDARIAALMPDGRAIYVVDIATGTARRTIKLAGHALKAKLSGDGSVLAVWSDYDIVRVWDTAKGKLLHELPAPWKKNNPYKPQWLALSADGKTLAWVGEEGACPIHVVDLSTGKESYVLKEHDGSERQIFLSPNGRFLLASSSVGVAQLWDLKQGRVRQKWTGRKDIPRPTAVFSPDGKRMALNLYDDLNWIRLIDLDAGKELAKLYLGTTVSSVADACAFAPDGKTLFRTWGGSPVVYRYDTTTCKRITAQGEMAENFRHVAFSPDETTVFTTAEDGIVRAWETATGKETRQVLSKVRGMFSPDGALLEIGTREGFDLREIATNNVRLRGEGYAVFSRDGRRVAAVGKNDISVLETATGKQLSTVRLPPGPFHRIQFAPDGKHLAILTETGEGCVLTFWESESGQEQRSIPLPLCDMSALLFSPEGRTVVVAARPGRAQPGLRIVELATGQQRQHIRVDKILPAYSWPPTVYFSPHGEYLLIGDGRAGVSMVHPLTGELLHRRQDHRGGVFRMVFSPSGRRLATISGDTTVLIWNTADFLRPAKPKPITLSNAELASAWDDLAADAGKAALAMRQLTRAPVQAANLLRQRLQPAVAVVVDAKQLDQWLADLDNESFEIRKRAEAEIEKVGESARPALHRMSAGSPSLEVRRAIERLTAKLDPASSPSLVRQVRGVEVLESLRTAETRAHLETLAEGAPDARLTRDAKAALERLDNRAR
jgi:RNA polymerase sigma factor (sigma-70 family)